MGIIETIRENVELKKSGETYFGLCPFHDEETPSFTEARTVGSDSDVRPESEEQIQEPFASFAT